MKQSYDNLHDRFLELTKVRMSNWYDIFGLFRTVVDIFLSGVFQSRIDHRTLRALELAKPEQASKPGVRTDGAPPSEPIVCGDFIDHGSYFEYIAQPGQEFWFDYAADVGDGFDSTYYVAALLAQKRLEVLREDPCADQWAPTTPGSVKAAANDKGQDEGKDKGKDKAASAAQRYQELPRGRFLLLGGDEVYPSASRKDYEMRFTRTYEAAAYVDRPPDKARAPHLYALPGNHDWYDGLSAFMEVFAERRSIGHYRTVQQTSYFAIKLPHGYWIFAIDIGLSGELDRRQVEYFKELATGKLVDGDRIILAIAEPDWVKARPNVRNLRDGLFYFERKLAEALGGDGPTRRDVRVVLRLAGDLHHYRRHVSREPLHPTDEAVERQAPLPTDDLIAVQNITSGGGGAFLHPTHEVDLDRGNSDGRGSVHQFPAGFGQKGLHFACEKAFPCVEESTVLTRRTLGFAFRNGSMFLALWGVYLLVMNLGLLLVTNHHYLWTAALFALLGLGVPAATASYARGEASGEIGEAKRGRVRRIYRRRPRLSRAGSWGALHGFLQVFFLLLVFLGLCATYRVIDCGSVISMSCESMRASEPPPAAEVDRQSLAEFLQFMFENDKWSSLRFGLAAVAAACASGLSCLLFGAYLFWALNKNKLRLHANGAFAALRIADYKNFLRIHVSKDGLDVHAVGIRKVPTSWSFDGSARRDRSDDENADGRPLFVPKRASRLLRAVTAAVSDPPSRHKVAHHYLTQVEPDSEPFLIEPSLRIPK